VASPCATKNFSRGVSGARQGACFMAGGEAEPIRLLEPMLQVLAVPAGLPVQEISPEPPRPRSDPRREGARDDEIGREDPAHRAALPRYT
jgi:hypothetical protein